MAPLAAVFGCAGKTLSDDERAFFRDADPLGFIIFARNVDGPDQLAALVASLRESVGRDDAPVLIDQEGGRVARLRGDPWHDAPPAARFGEIAARDPDAACEAARINARLIADDLLSCGIDVDCAPVADLRLPEGHGVIGDRAYGSDPTEVVPIARSAAAGLLEGGVQPIAKHVPGHGRADVDSHHELPCVSAGTDLLEATDFATFRALSDLPWMMTAHVIYAAVDDVRPATISPDVVSNVIRASIGFDGLLITDDLSMKALAGSEEEKASAALAAGCDVLLHCNGARREMEGVALGGAALSGQAAERFRRARAAAEGGRRLSLGERKDLAGRLDAILEGA